MIKEAYPLQWPVGWKRNSNPKRSQFGSRSIDASTRSLIGEVKRLNGIRHNWENVDCIISTDLKLRQDGLPYSSQRQPDDKGVAAYFKFKKQDIVIACDSYDSIQDNIYAIGKTIEAMRAIERYGASDLLQRAFTGFQALPSPSQGNWWEVLECKEDDDADTVTYHYRRLAKKLHPDVPGGSKEKFQELKFVYDQAMKLKQQ